MYPRSDARTHVRRLDPARDLAGVRRVYDAWRVGKTGPLVRSDFWWNDRVLPKIKDGVVFAPRGEVRAYALYDTSGEPNRIARDMVVRELVAADSDGRRALHGWLASLGDQFRRVFLLLPREEAAASVTHAPAVDVSFFYRFHRVGRTVAGEMVRILRLADALGAHPGPARSGVAATIGLDLVDPVFSDQSGPFDVTIDRRGARAKKGRRAEGRLSLDVGALSQIYMGALRARDLLDAGAIQGDPRAAEALDLAFAGPTSFKGDLNGY
jgi:predicted acetyltransferase